jgi:hypothetical protein
VPGVRPWCCTISPNGPPPGPGVLWTLRPGRGPVSWSAGPSATRCAVTG